MICFRCGATVDEAAESCPSCEQELSAGATLAATPHAVGKTRERSEKKARPRKERSDITHQLSVEDIFEEFAADEEEFLGESASAANDDETTSTFNPPAAPPADAGRDDSSPLLGVGRASAARRAIEPEPIRPVESMDLKLQTGPIPLAPPPRAPRADPPRSASAASVAPAETRAPSSEPRVSTPSDPEPVTGEVLQLDKPKPLPDLAPALEPEPPPARRTARVAVPGQRPSPVAPAAVTAPSRGSSVVALAVMGVSLGLAMATVASIVLVVRQDDQEADARRARAVKRVQDRLREAERLRTAGPLGLSAPTLGAEGCPLAMRRLGTTVPYCIDIYEHPGGRTLPRSNVTWREAQAACQARRARLCTAAEWEAACRGPEDADYPYGARFEPGRCTVARAPSKPRDIAETGAHAGCKSASLIYDMSGNVAEWVADGAYHGGSAESDAAGARCSAKVTPAPEASSPYVGFRCCAEPRGVGQPPGAASAPAAAAAPAAPAGAAEPR